MLKTVLLTLLWISSLLAALQVQAAGEYCPEYQRENKELARQIKQDMKAYARSEGVPERLMYLYDQLGDCLQCLGGDGQHPLLPVIHIEYVSNDNPNKPAGLRNIKSYMTAWSADLEYEARQGMRDGYVRAYYILIETTPCECCTASTQEEYDAYENNVPDPTDSPTFDENLDFDTSVADVHDDPNNMGEDPPDLTEVPSQDVEWEMVEPPPLRLPPPVRPMTTLCTPCREAVNAHNDYAIQVNQHTRNIAKIIQRLGIDRILIREVLQEIRQWEQKAQVESVLAKLDELSHRYGDLVGSSTNLLRELTNARRQLDAMMSKLDELKEAVRECEHLCVEGDATATGVEPAAAVPPTSEPEPPVEDCPAEPARRDLDAEYEAQQIIEQMKDFARQAGVPSRLMALYDGLPLCPECLRSFALGDVLPYFVAQEPNLPGMESWLQWNTGQVPVLLAFYLGIIDNFEVALNFPGCTCCDEAPDGEAFVHLYADTATVVGDFPHAGFVWTPPVRGCDSCPEAGSTQAAPGERVLAEVAALFQLGQLQTLLYNNRAMQGGYGFPGFLRGDYEASLQARAQTLIDEYGSYENLVAQLQRENVRCLVLQCYAGAIGRPYPSVEPAPDPYLQPNLGDVLCLRDYHTVFFEEQQGLPSPPSTCRGSPLLRWFALEAILLQAILDRYSQTPADPYFSERNDTHAGSYQWGLQRVARTNSTERDDLWSIGGEPIVVAVIDSGLDLEHPDMVSQVFTNPDEVPGNGRDDDGNGYTDDVHGWNFITESADVEDTNGHGTMVAGIVAAAVNNGIGIAGVNPQAKILPLKVTNFVGRGRSVDIARAIDYAISSGARVINISLGGVAFSKQEHAAVTRASDAGIVVVVAAGNENMNAGEFWPAGYDNVITVAASDITDQRAPFSNFGAPVDITAPGRDIVSLRARYTDMMYFAAKDYEPGANIVGDEKYLYRSSGTSFAAPFVSGAASLLLSRRPQLNAVEVRRLLLQSAQDADAPGVDHLTGYGVLNVPGALQGDAAFHVDALISGVDAAVQDGRQVVRVHGWADADKFRRATVSVGKGKDPSKWQDIADIKRPVLDGILAAIPATTFAGAKQWVIRLETRHKNGRTREFRFLLNLG